MLKPSIRILSSLFLWKAASLILLVAFAFDSKAQKIHKFERLGVADGLSQNYVQSILCDNKGFMWFGTWDGLNRYDGRQFKIFKADPKQINTLTNNRIIDLWQDKQNILWVKTNDGYIHYFIDESYEFITFPYYLKSMEEKNSTIVCIAETNNQEVLLGSSNSGLYYLTYNEDLKRYNERQFLNRGISTISDNSISFIINDGLGDIWLGTKKGLNNISQAELSKETPSFANYWLNYNFTKGIALDSILIFGTKENGIKTYELKKRRFNEFPDNFHEISDQGISVLKSLRNNKLLVGTMTDGLHIFDLNMGNKKFKFLKDKHITKVFIDSFETIWVNTEEFGIYRIDVTTNETEHYDLLPENIKSIIDDERQFIYEDSQNNLWIALHGGGLAHFNREINKFEYYRNVPNDNTTISSDNVYCITEDQSGLLWVGTGPSNGGVNKIYTSNDAFQSIRPEENPLNGNENVIRALLVDQNGNIWVGSKSGTIYVLNQQYELLKKFAEIPLTNGMVPGQNAYTMLQDKEGFLWIGTKGGGLFVSEYPLHNMMGNFDNLKFHQYTNDPNNDQSISSNIIYSIFEDSKNRIWIGSYEKGLNLVVNRKESKLICARFNTSNSNLSSDNVRHISEDHDRKLWITTSFGINYLNVNNFDINNPVIQSNLYDPRLTNSLSYNDVIHAFEDSKQQLWFGTSGGGINQLMKSDSNILEFEHLTTKDGLVNDVVYGILEDYSKNIWFSTDHGISRYNPETDTFDNFDQSNNLSTDSFNENTCAIAKDGKLLFGTNDGILVVDPNKIEKTNYMPAVAFTNFQLFNKDINIHDPESPIKQDIETLDKIELKAFQSSFSIEYVALSFFSPTKNKYAFMLENFDEQWNEVGNQNKATYTNLAPGEYIFKVKAANWNSDWSDKTRSINITIMPPWWKTTIMYIIYAIVLILVFEIVRRSYLRYHKLQNDLMVEKRVNDIKLQFFTNISHEIRTPLTLILGPIHDLLEIKNIPANISNKLHLVEKNGKRMLRLVNQLLDFRKVQKNKMEIKVHKIELISFMRSLIENFELIADHKEIKIYFEPKQESLAVWVDPNKFDSVIFNILSNALKFSPQATTVDIEINSSEEKYIDISIKDQGAGIPRERINLIFERFSPLSKDNDEFGSSGIGLAYSYQIMKLHHGDIVLESEPKKGSTFKVRLLTGSGHFDAEEIQHDEGEFLYQIKHEKVIEEDEDNLDLYDSKINGNEQSILIVEDNLQILNYLKENLRKDYNISTAMDGKEALSAIQNQQPDILITDIMMPIMNGIELTYQLKESIETSHIPVIMLTAKSTMEDQIEGVESGAEAYILKPFNMTYVRAIISNLIKQRSYVQMKYIRDKDHRFADLKITNKDQQFMDDVNKYIIDNYANPEFNIEKLVEFSYVSRTVFYNKIKSLTGLAPIEYLRQKRLHFASQLIVKSDYNISEIANNTGFNDTKYFSKQFKKQYGMTPTEFKIRNIKVYTP